MVVFDLKKPAAQSASVKWSMLNGYLQMQLASWLRHIKMCAYQVACLLGAFLVLLVLGSEQDVHRTQL